MMSLLENIKLSEKVFDFPYKPALVHQVVVAYLANARSGNVSQKTRSEVRGGGKKPWKQKGTGRARAGTSRGPIWRGGGQAFAAKPQDYSQKVNKKMYRQGVLCLLSELNRQEKLKIVDSFEMEKISTKEMTAMLKEWNLKGRVLIVDDVLNQNAWLSVRNVPNVYLVDAQEVNPYFLAATEYVVLTENAIKKLEVLYGNA